MLRFGAERAAPGVIAVLSQQELERLTTPPSGVVLVEGAPFSHPALRLLSRGVPTVLAEAGQLEGLTEGMEILLDGASGLLLSPLPDELPAYAPPPPPATGLPICTADGIRVELRASIGSASAAADAVTQGASAIGLVRSEYLFPPDGSRPDAAFLVRAFDELCRAAHPLRVTFRLLDIAGDKRPPWLGNLPGIASVLGLQGARLYDREPVRRVYLQALQALGSVAESHPVDILLPYVVSVAELESRVAEIRRHVPASVRIGSMLETPAAALAVDDFLGVADFAALGCNDLMQCLFAADRDLPELRGFLDPHAPVLYRFLAEVAERAGASQAGLQVCGLLAQRPGVLPVLLGLGYRVFSVDPVMIPWLALSAAQTDTKQAEKLADAVCAARRPAEVRQLLGETNSSA